MMLSAVTVRHSVTKLNCHIIKPDDNNTFLSSFGQVRIASDLSTLLRRPQVGSPHTEKMHLTHT